MVRIQEANLYHVAVPMKRTLRHALASRSVAENIVVEISLAGRTGIGECAPRTYVTGESVDSVWDRIASFDLGWIDSRLRLESFESAVASVEALDLPRELGTPEGPGLAAACALELALLDAIGKVFDRPLEAVARALGVPEAYLGHHRFAFPQGWAVGLGDTMDSIPVDRATYLKVKIGPDMQQNFEQMQEIRRTVGSGMPLCVDANMAWTLEGAREAVARFERFGIAWYEEPLARGAFADYAELRRSTGARVMLDESLCTLEDGREALRHGACDFFNIRISKVGGFIPAIRLAELALSRGVWFQIGAHAGQMGILWAAGIHLASCLEGHVAFESGLTRQLFDRQIVRECGAATDDPFEERSLPGSGLGVSLVSPGELAAFCPRRATWSAAGGSRWSTVA